MHFFSLSSADIMDDIKAANEKFMAAFDGGDATALSQLYTEDCKLMPTGSDVVMGREGIADICMCTASLPASLLPSFLPACLPASACLPPAHIYVFLLPPLHQVLLQSSPG